MDHSPVIEPKGQRGRAFAKQDPNRAKRETNARAANVKKQQSDGRPDTRNATGGTQRKPSRNSKFR